MRLLLFFTLQCYLVMGHGELDQKILSISEKIAADPDNPSLLLSRAVLHQSHRDPDAALEDLLRATRISPLHPPAFLQLARFQRIRGSKEEALKTINQYFSLPGNKAPDLEAYRERALLSAPKVAINDWAHFIKTKKEVAMSDYAEASQSAIAAKEQNRAHSFLLQGLQNYPKSITLHHLYCRLALSRNDPKTAHSSFDTLEILYPALLVKLRFEESLIWDEFNFPAFAQKSQTLALDAFKNLPKRLKDNPDLIQIIKKIEAARSK